MLKRLGIWLALGIVAFAQNPQTQIAPVYAVNAKYVNGVAPGYAPTAGSGLYIILGPGTVNCIGTIITYTGSGSPGLALTASTVNYVYLNTAASCAPAVKTSSYTSSDIPVAMVTAGSSTISAIVDDRTIFNVPGSGSSGTVNSGTTNQVAVYSSPGTAVAGSNSISLAGTVSGAGVQDTLRPWVDAFTVSTPVSSTCGSGTDEFAKLCQLGVNADGTYTFNLFRDTGHSGTTVTASVSPFAPYLTAIPFTGTVTNTRIRLDGTYVIPGELDIPEASDIDGQTLYPFYGTPRTGTWIEASSTFPLASSQAGTVVVNLGSASNPSGDTSSLFNRIHDIGVDCLTTPWATGVLNGTSQQGSGLTNVAIHDCQYGVSVQDFGDAGGAQNHGVINGVGVNPVATPSGMWMTGAVMTAGGSSYTSAPTVAVTGCSTAPSYTAALTANAVSSITAVYPNYFGAGCSPGSTSIGFSGGGGSGAAATPIIQMPPPSIGFRLGGVVNTGGGLYYNNDVVSGAYSVNQNIGFILDNNNEYLIDSYAESQYEGICAGCGGSTSGMGGDVIIGARTEGANEPVNTVIDLSSNRAYMGIAMLGINTQGTTLNYLTDEQPNGGTCHADASNTAGLPLYVRSGNSVLSMCRDIATTGQVDAISYLNCGSCTTSNYPRQYLPVKNINGYAQSMALGDTAQPAGIAYNGLFDTVNTHRVAVGGNGAAVPLAMDPGTTVTAGDYVCVSTNTVVSGYSIAGGVDCGSTWPPAAASGRYVLGQVVNTGVSGSLSIPSTPSVGSATVTGSAGDGITYSYQVTSTFTDGSKTESEPSSTMTTSNGPYALVAGATVTVAGLTSSTYNAYRTAMGSSSLPTLTAVMAGTQLAQITGLPAGTGYTFAPTGTFSGGSCTTEPAVQFFAIAGVISGYNITNAGNCTGTPTLTLAKSTCETGKLPQFTGASFVDHGYCLAGETPPAAGELAPSVAVQIQYAGVGGTGNVNGPASSTVGDVASFNATNGTVIQDTGVPAANLPSNKAPLWLQYLGTGADGAESVTSGSVGLVGEKYYTTFNVSSGATVTVSSSLIVHATGACTINGNILANGAAVTIGATAPKGAGGGSSGGSGGGAAAGTAGNISYQNNVYTGYAAAAGGTGGGASGGNGGYGVAMAAGYQRGIVDGGFGLDMYLAAGAIGTAGGSSGGSAGEQGGSVILICASITGTGIIDAAGGYGNPPSANSTGGGSGGGGGIVVLSSQAAETYGITIDTGGGPGQSSSTGSLTVPYAVPAGTSSVASGNQCTTDPVLTLGVTTGAISSCSVAIAGSGCGSSPSVNWTALGGGGSGAVTVTPTWSSGTVASCTASGGTGYTATTYTTAGAGGQGGAGWSAEFSGW